MQTLFMGYSQTDITPDHAVQLIGFNRGDNTSRGIRDPLLAQASVWKHGGEVSALITIDHIGFSKEHANELRNRVAQTLGSARERVMLCFSHTHAAPNEDMEEGFRLDVYRKACECAAEALRYMRPVRVGWGNAVGNIGFNRRKESTATDDRIGILKVVDAATDGLRLILLRVTAHANVLKRDNHLISADYFGAMRDVLKEKYGCPVMVTQGAAGNIAPRFVCSDLILADANDERVVHSQNALQETAEEAKRQVTKVFEKIVCRPVKRVSMYSRYIELYSEVPDDDRASKTADEAYRNVGINGDAWLAEVRRLRQEQVYRQTDDTEVQFFVIDEWTLCGTANELMCEFALDVWHRTGNEYCYFGGYTNGCTAYFPTEEEFDRGGYEVYWCMLLYYKYYGRVFPLDRDSAARLTDFVAAELLNDNT